MAAWLHAAVQVSDSKFPARAGKLAAWFCVLLVVTFVALIRTRVAGTPLERDEGEYAYAGQLMLQGIPPYKLAYNMKFPGTYAAYALIMSIFGQTIGGIHIGLLLVNAATVTLIFFLGKRLMDWIGGIAAAMSYAVLSLSASVLGFAAHATHFVMLPVLGGVLLLQDQSGRKEFGRLFVSGLLFGLGLLMKQPAAFFALFGAIYLLLMGSQRRLGFEKILVRNVVFGAGVIFPFGITCLLLWSTGVFDKFWFWTVNYAREYATMVPLPQATQLFADTLKHVIGAAWPLWLLAVIGLAAGLVNARSRGATAFLVGLLAFSLLAVCPGFYFRNHYFILLLPAVSLLVGAAISKLYGFTASYARVFQFVPVLVLGIALGLPIFLEKRFFFEVSPIEACRTLYPESPFPASIRIAEYVRDHSNANDTIAVLGSEPQIYFYSKRHSATGYIYTYGLMERQKYAHEMQQEMIREIELARPKYLISVVMKDSWLPRPGSDRHIFAWANEYTGKYYDVVGFVNMIAADRSDYYFDEVPKSVPQLGNYILIYQRKA
jgi:hypothetical protein